MPGILPMKMIRVGVSSQSRIAQACDRCRSKKIRCDGIRPCCTQCSNVGFECKTSDKLSRRAFPRGYTESLEDRVRALEAEVRDLKNLLDEKDEKIDMLSRIHNFSPQSRKSSLSPTSSNQLKSEAASPTQDLILVEIPAPVYPAVSSTGTSTTAALIEAFETKVQDNNRSCPAITSGSLLKPSLLASNVLPAQSPNPASSIPPRLLSDQYINVFFQEWQPLLPILHRPSFLRIYEKFLVNPDDKQWQLNKLAVAQLFLIFEIAAYSASSRTRPVTSGYELRWRKALSSISSNPAIETLQCHLLAQLCFLLKADYSHLLRHRAYAVSIVHQLCLHQGHKGHSLSVFTAETRRKVFWCQYVLDKFTSATTGTPQMLRDADITAEYPSDVDDEYIGAHGMSPSPPGELTKTSSALALFRVSRILGKALENLYPAKASYQLSLTKLYSLSDELDQWQEELPDHLRLRFCNDKPSTNTISCRSPLLSLAYFYTRSLIHRPLLCHGTGSAASAATIMLSAAAKHQLQILDLLDERSMNYTFPVNKQDVLLNAGFCILWQSLDLDDDSKLVKDNQKSLNLVLSKLTWENQAASSELSRVVGSFVSLSESSSPYTRMNTASPAGRAVDSTSTTNKYSNTKPARKSLQAIASRFPSFNGKAKNEEGIRRASMSQTLSQMPQSIMSSGSGNDSTTSLSSTKSAPAQPGQGISTTVVMSHLNRGFDPSSAVNLDYFPLANDGSSVSNGSSTTMLPPKKNPSPGPSVSASWDQLVSTIDPETPDMFMTVSPTALNHTGLGEWNPELWPATSTLDGRAQFNAPRSHLSFSDDSLTSGDDVVFSAPASNNGSMSSADSAGPPAGPTIEEAYKGITIPVDDDFGFENVV